MSGTPASQVGGFWGAVKPLVGAPQQIMPHVLPKAVDAGKMKSGVTPVEIGRAHV